MEEKASELSSSWLLIDAKCNLLRPPAPTPRPCLATHSDGKQYLVTTAPWNMATAILHNYELLNSETYYFFPRITVT